MPADKSVSTSIGIPISIASRLRAIERLVLSETEHEDHFQEWMEAIRLEREAFLLHIPIHLREAFRAAAAHDRTEQISERMLCPFAKWAMPVLADYLFPDALVEFMLNPPRDFWMGHQCEGCGLTLPLYVTWENDPDPPKELTCFLICPACSGGTYFGAEKSRNVTALNPLEVSKELLDTECNDT